MADRQYLERLTRECADKGLLIEAGWVGYRLAVMPADASPVQLEETKFAFFAGAQHLFGSIMNMLDPGAEETEADLHKMDQINTELQRFSRDLELRVHNTKGSA